MKASQAKAVALDQELKSTKAIAAAAQMAETTGTTEIASLKNQLASSQASQLTLTETLCQVQADKTEMEIQ